MFIKILVIIVFIFSAQVAEAKQNEKTNDTQGGIRTSLKGVKASWYGEAICRGRKLCKTASGKLFKPKEEFTTACWGEYPFFTVFRVTYNGRSIEVSCTDRGAFKSMNRFLDLSSSAFEKLAPLKRGILTVDVEVIK